MFVRRETTSMSNVSRSDASDEFDFDDLILGVGVRGVYRRSRLLQQTNIHPSVGIYA
jgi:hypothetical protein